METAERQHKIIAIGITVVVHALLFLLFILVMFRIPNPPFPESGKPGLEINFGNMVEGTGDTEANGIGDANPNNSTTAKTEKTNPSSTDNKILTNDAETSISMKKTDTQNKTDNKTDNPTKIVEETPSSELAQALSKLKNKKNGTGGDGNSGKAGNEGDPNGKPDATGGGGDKNYPNYQLSGRVMTKKPQLVDDSQEEGKVVVDIVVDKTGKVSTAVPGARGSTTTSALLFAKARQAALSSKFNESPNGADEQKGSITFIFILN